MDAFQWFPRSVSGKGASTLEPLRIGFYMHRSGDRFLQPAREKNEDLAASAMFGKTFRCTVDRAYPLAQSTWSCCTRDTETICMCQWKKHRAGSEEGREDPKSQQEFK